MFLHVGSQSLFNKNPEVSWKMFCSHLEYFWVLFLPRAHVPPWKERLALGTLQAPSLANRTTGPTSNKRPCCELTFVVFVSLLLRLNRLDACIEGCQLQFQLGPSHLAPAHGIRHVLRANFLTCNWPVRCTTLPFAHHSKNTWYKWTGRGRNAGDWRDWIFLKFHNLKIFAWLITLVPFLWHDVKFAFFLIVNQSPKTHIVTRTSPSSRPPWLP